MPLCHRLPSEGQNLLEAQQWHQPFEDHLARHDSAHSLQGLGSTSANMAQVCSNVIMLCLYHKISMPRCPSRTILRATEPVGSVDGQIDGEQGYTCVMVTVGAGILQGQCLQQRTTTRIIACSQGQ